MKIRIKKNENNDTKDAVLLLTLRGATIIYDENDIIIDVDPNLIERIRKLFKIEIEYL